MKRYALAGIVLFLAILAYDERHGFAVDVVEGRVANLTQDFQGDAESYYRETLRMPLPCLDNDRPPLFFITGRLGLLFAGDTSLAAPDLDRPLAEYPPEFVRKTRLNQSVLRMVSVWHSMGALVAVFFLGILVGGPLVGIICAALWTFFAWDVFYSVCFLRTGLVSFLNTMIVAFFILLLRTPPTAVKRRCAIAAGVVTALVLSILTRQIYLTLTVQLLVAYNLVLLATRRWSKHELTLSVAILGAVFLMILPYLAHNRINTGSFTPALNANAAWWASHEFAGQPGFPTREELARGEYLDRELSSSEYIFGMHTPTQIIGRFVKGYAKAFLDDLPRRTCFVFMTTVQHTPWLMLLAPVGVIASFARRREGLFLLIALLIFMLPFAFIIPVDYVLTANPLGDDSGVEARFIMPLFPFAFLYCALAIQWLWRLIGAQLGLTEAPTDAVLSFTNVDQPTPKLNSAERLGIVDLGKRPGHIP